MGLFLLRPSGEQLRVVELGLRCTTWWEGVGFGLGCAGRAVAVGRAGGGAGVGCGCAMFS